MNMESHTGRFWLVAYMHACICVCMKRKPAVPVFSGGIGAHGARHQGGRVGQESLEVDALAFLGGGGGGG